MNVSLNAKTKWGDIYSNFTLDIDKKSSSNRDWNHIIANVMDQTDRSYNWNQGMQISI